MGVNVAITNELARVAGLIANKHPEHSIQIEWREGSDEREWVVTASNGLTDMLYVVDDESGTWAPFTEADRRRYDAGLPIFT